jgi:hypothetical protein
LDRFSFFFAFYGLILGLAVAELLSGFVSFARERRVRDLEIQTALLALLVFVDVCATWLDAYETLRGITLSFGGLAAPIMVATGFYLGAAMVFPRNSGELDNLQDYYMRRHGFVASMLLMAEVFLSFTFWAQYRNDLIYEPAKFWLWHVPYKLALVSLFAALAFARTRRSNLLLLTILLFLFSVPYWTLGEIPQWIHERFDQPTRALRS